MEILWSTKDQLVDRYKPKKISGLSSADITRMEKEREKLGKDFIVIKDAYGRDTFNLVLATGYLSKLMDNAQVVRFFFNHYFGILSEFHKRIEATSMGKLMKN